MADEEYEAEDAGADYDDIAEEDDNIEETEEQEEDGYNVQCVAPGQAGGGVEKSKRITTRYMTKYERARVLANYPLSVVQGLPSGLLPGVYYGWAQVDKGPIHKMVANIGWCPMYQNKEMSVETHIFSHKFDDDFYGSNLKVGIIGYLRGEMKFPSLEDLKQQIKQDIADAEGYLEKPDAKQILNHSFFTSS